MKYIFRRYKKTADLLFARPGVTRSLFYKWLMYDSRISTTSKYNFLNFDESCKRAQLKSFCFVTGFPRSVSKYSFLYSRHVFNLKASAGAIPGYGRR